MENLIERLIEIANENPDGFTVKIPSCEYVKFGWVVAMKETQNSFGIEGLIKVIRIANESTHIVGGWKDGAFYWDAVYIIQDENEATQLGIDNEQLAIYHLETQTLKRLI